MKKLIQVALIVNIMYVLIAISAHAQTPTQSFRLINESTLSQETFYKQSIASANLENYRLRNERVKLSFQEGFQVELYSASELVGWGFANINPQNYPESFTGAFLLPVFRINPDGWLIAEYPNLNPFSK